MVPLQLIYEGKTSACQVEATDETISHSVHITHSKSHWSTLETMKQYFEIVLQSFIREKIKEHDLPFDSKSIVILDCWNIHKSKEFIEYVRKTHTNILLVFVPANCTSKFHVAADALNYSFKHLVKIQFEDWACQRIGDQLERGDPIDFSVGMGIVKPLSRDWSIQSWLQLNERTELIRKGWHRCFLNIDPFDAKTQEAAIEKVMKNQLTAYGFVPNEPENEFDANYYDCSSDSASNDDELDVLRRRVEGSRKSVRNKKQPNLSGYLINTQQIELDDDEEESFLFEK